jgi:hypothetical protein
LAPRPKHQDDDLEALIRSLEGQGWVVERGKKHYKAKCSCESKHLKTINCTPSDPNYGRNIRGKLRRDTCWEAEA